MAQKASYNVLVIGDAQIPARAVDIPRALKQRLKPGRVDMVVSVGNLSAQPVLDYLKTLAPQVVAVRGPLDEPAMGLPWRASFRVGGARGPSVGAVSGFQAGAGGAAALARVAAEMGADVLLCAGPRGAEERGGALLVRPGSATGLYGAAGYAVLRVEEGGITVYQYSADGDEVRVEETFVERSYELARAVKGGKAGRGGAKGAADESATSQSTQESDESSDGRRTGRARRRRRLDSDSDE